MASGHFLKSVKLETLLSKNPSEQIFQTKLIQYAIKMIMFVINI